MGRIAGTSLVVALIIAIGFNVTGDTKQEVFAHRLKHINSSTLALFDPLRDSIYCGGVWLNDFMAITAKHCLTLDDPELFEEFENRQDVGDKLMRRTVEVMTYADYGLPRRVPTMTASVVATDRGDLALLRVTQRTHHDNATVGKEVPAIGSSVDIVGHTLGLGWTYMPGTVSFRRRFQKNPLGMKEEFLQMVGGVHVGNSGGGVFNDSAELVGIVSFISEYANSVSFSVHVDEIRDFLRRQKVQYRLTSR